jgi:hypothetical protein
MSAAKAPGDHVLFTLVSCHQSRRERGNRGCLLGLYLVGEVGLDESCQLMVVPSMRHFYRLPFETLSKITDERFRVEELSIRNPHS